MERIVVHALTDGRDTRPDAALEASPRSRPPARRVGTVCGRYCGMDRDRRWDRTQRAYDAMVHGVGEHRASGREAVRLSYDLGVTDEFIEPAVIGAARREPHPPRRRRSSTGTSAPTARASSPMAFSDPDFDGFDRGAAGPARADDDDPLQGRVHARRCSSRRRTCARAWPRPSRAPAAASCTWPRPRSTPTSPSSSTAGARSRSRASGACWCPRPSTCRPTTTPPR